VERAIQAGIDLNTCELSPQARDGRSSSSSTPAASDAASEATIKVANRELVARLHAAVTSEVAGDTDFRELEEVVKAIVSADASLDTLGPDGESTAFYTAADHGHTLASELLRRNGADIMLVGSGGVSPLFIACYKGHDKVAANIINALPTYERWRAIHDHKENGEVIIRRGDIFVPDNFGKVSSARLCACGCKA
jgi:hypothetical protein